MIRHIGPVAVETDRLHAICSRYRVRALYVFGSAARGDYTVDSDIDFVVDFEPGEPVGLLTVGALQMDLQDLMGRPVDLITEVAAARSRLREAVLRDRQVLYVR
jgi:predicted nucleotidyltransferase